MDRPPWTFFSKSRRSELGGERGRPLGAFREKVAFPEKGDQNLTVASRKVEKWKSRKSRERARERGQGVRLGI